MPKIPLGNLGSAVGLSSLLLVLGCGASDLERAPALSLSDTRLDFGAVGVGESAERVLLVSNPGEARARRLELSADGEVPLCDERASSPFCVQASGLDLPPGVSTALHIGFAPEEAGLQTARLVLEGCAASSCPTVIELSGEGRSRAIECAPASVRFDALDPGARATETVTCRSTLAAGLEVSAWRIASGSDAAFSVEPSRSVILESGERLALELGFVLRDRLPHRG